MRRTSRVISDGLVALLKEFYGRGPTRAKSYYEDDLVVCVLRGFSRVEQTLLDEGRGDPASLERGLDLHGRSRAPPGHRHGRGRAQAVPLPRWRAHRDRLKFDTMLAFGEALPRLGRRVVRDLASVGPARLGVDDLNRERVLACSVRLLDLGFLRIGSEDYAERNESYGLTTVLRDHVTIVDREAVFDFPAKSGQRRVQAITDTDALAVVAALRRRRSGSQLLAYREADGESPWR